MSAVSGRTTDAVADALRRWWPVRHGTSVAIRSIERPTVGEGSETNMVELDELVDGEDRPRSVVVRLAPDGAGTHQEFDLRAQVVAQDVAAAAGVPIAAPLEYEPDPSWMGQPFLVMRKVDGHIATVPGWDPWVCSLSPADQARLAEIFLETVATIHRSDAAAAVDGGVRVRDVGDELDVWRRFLDWGFDGAPPRLLTRAIDHLDATAPPPSDDRVLLWGDVRIGNVIVGDELRPLAVLDWDMTTVGPREQDIGWMTAVDLIMTTAAGTNAPGWPDRAALLAGYEAASGRSLQHHEWYETFALYRLAAYTLRIVRVQEMAGVEVTYSTEGTQFDLLEERLPG